LINHKIEILRAQTWWYDKWKVLLREPFNNVKIIIQICNIFIKKLLQKLPVTYPYSTKKIKK